MSTSTVVATGKLPALRADNLSRLAMFLVRGDTVLGETSVRADGTFQLTLAASLASEHGVAVVLGPKGLDHHALFKRSELPRLELARAHDVKRGHAVLDFAALALTDEAIDLWWRWCREYTVSGTLRGADGCPVPGAAVTVYSVNHGFIGLIKTPRETVQTDQNGAFSASFNWCECACVWPCWPIWWHCFPWWWELDMLHVIEQIERSLPLRQTIGARAITQTTAAPLKRPPAADLLTGQGFAAARSEIGIVQDPSRTAKIARSLNDARVRELFPWFWWCAQNPNIVFSATQNGQTILDENPYTSTRWDFAGGQSVALIASAQAIALCPGPPPPFEGFVWSQVGDTHVDHITQGYADGPGGDASDLAFAGTLAIQGAFADPNVAFYQVLAGLWTGNGNPRRSGGMAPVAYSPLSAELIATAIIFRAATGAMPAMVEFADVVMGPCSFAGKDNLYMTMAQRANPPAGVTGLPPFPALAAGDHVLGWADAGRMVNASASALIAGGALGGVRLTVDAYLGNGSAVTLATNVPLDLMIDTTGINAGITSLTAYEQNGTQVGESTSSANPCPSYKIGTGGYVLLRLAVSDASGHLSGYYIETEFGHGSTGVPTVPAGRGYSQAPATFTTPASPGDPVVDAGYGVPDKPSVTFVGGGDSVKVSPVDSCCYDFRLWASKRVTDGKTFFTSGGTYDFQTASIDTTPIP